MKTSVVNSAEYEKMHFKHFRVKTSCYWHKSVIGMFLGLITLSVMFCPFFYSSALSRNNLCKEKNKRITN